MARRGSNEPDNPRERRWQRENEERQYKRIVDQLNKLRSAGYNTEDINAAAEAGRGNAWRELQGYNLVKDQTTGQWVYRDSGYSQPTTPGAVAGAGGTPGLNATTAPAWATQSYTGPQATNLQWWQRGTPTQPVVGGGAPKVLPMPTEVRRDPFAGVTGSVGLGPNQEGQRQPAYGGSYNPGAPRPASPYIPQWLTGRPPAYGGSYNPTAMSSREGSTEAAAPSGAAPGTRWVDPKTGIPDFPMLSSLQSAPTTGAGYSYGGGYSSPWYKPRRRGGSGGSRPSYPQRGYPSKQRSNTPFVPSSGLANWSIG